jgi:hypothetical protein
VNPGVKRRALDSGYAVGPEAYARYDPFRIMVDMGRRGLWQARKKTLRWRRSAREERPCCFEKRRRGLPGTEHLMVPGQPKDGQGRRQAISLLGILDGKTLKHTKTTGAESEVR